MGQMRAHLRAILNVDAPRLVDEYAHEPAAGRVVPIDQLVAQRGQRAFQNIGQLQQWRRHETEKVKKKWAVEPISYRLHPSRIIAKIPADLKGAPTPDAAPRPRADPGPRRLIPPALTIG